MNVDGVEIIVIIEESSPETLVRKRTAHQKQESDSWRQGLISIIGYIACNLQQVELVFV